MSSVIERYILNVKGFGFDRDVGAALGFDNPHNLGAVYVTYIKLDTKKQTTVPSSWTIC